MEREVKFRGYALTQMLNSQWLTGFGVDSVEFTKEYAKEIGKDKVWYLYTDSGPMEVDPDSIGQYTGLQDREGNPICEGDIVSIRAAGEEHIRHIQFDQGTFHFGYIPDGMCDYKDMKVIGNIYDNPELLQQP